MNKYLPIIFIPLLFSCEKIFHEHDYSEYLILDKYEEKIHLINNIYVKLAGIHNNQYFSLLRRSDDINSYDKYDFRPFGFQCDYIRIPQNLNDVIGPVYDKLYGAVINANKLITSFNENDTSELLGEVYFLRAYCYLKLTRLFGRPPLVKDIEVNYLLPKPSYHEVYDFIESDLLKAIELLPDTYTESRVLNETPHKGSAKALLAEVYLSMAGYPVNDKTKNELAAKLAGEVIENAHYYGFTLLDDFADLWKEKNRYNKENIFGLFFKPYTPDSTDYFNHNFLNSFNTIGQGSFIPEFKFFNDFPHNYRKLVSITTGKYMYREITISETIEVLYYLKYNPLIDPCNYLKLVSSLKWKDPGEMFRPGTFKTIYLLRYAQTLLTYAEAKGHLGELDESAFNAVNMVRRRSNKSDIHSTSAQDLQPGLTAAQFTDSVIWERAWELFQEPDGRWFDIIRLDLKDKLSEYRYNDFDFPDVITPNYLTNDWYFYKIPQEDRWLNPNFEEDE